jgi:hypothetical protein
MGHTAVKCGIKAGHLEYARIRLLAGFNSADRLGQMLRVNGDKFAERLQQRRIYGLRLAVAAAAVNDPMPHGLQASVVLVLMQPGEQRLQRSRVIGQVALLIEERCAPGIGNLYPTAGEANPFRLGRDVQPFLIAHIVQGCLQAGRAGVDGQYPPGVLVSHSAVAFQIPRSTRGIAACCQMETFQPGFVSISETLTISR